MQSKQLKYLAAQHGYRLTHVKFNGSYRYYLWDADGQLAADGASFDDSELREYLEAH